MLLPVEWEDQDEREIFVVETISSGIECSSGQMEKRVRSRDYCWNV